MSPQRYPRGYRAEADWAAEFRTEFGLQDRPLIVLAGRLTRLKGHFDFLTLMQELGRRGSDVMGLIVGGEDPRRKQYAAELRAAVSDCPNVVMTGHRSDLREVMSLGSVVLSLSTKPESFGRTVLEALSLGIPVAGYDHGGVGEVLSALFPEGRVAPGDHAALANTVERLLTSPCPTIAENTDFTLESMLQRTLDLYESVGQRP